VVYHSVMEYRVGIDTAKENALRAVRLVAVSQKQKQVMTETNTCSKQGASLEIAGQRAEELRQGVERLELGHGGKTLKPVTISLGVACFPEHGASWEAALKTADAALYRAKAAGRNCVVMAARPHPEGAVPPAG